MTRLTNDIRDRIVVNALCKAGVTAASQEHAKQMKILGNDIRIEALGGPAEEKRLIGIDKKIRELTFGVKGAANRETTIRFQKYFHANIGGQTRYFEFAGADEPACICGSDITLKATHKLAARLAELDNVESDINERRKTIKSNVKAALSQVNTIRQLIQQWPEASELLDGIAQDVVKTNLPAITVADLNAQIGLPTEKRDAKKPARKANR